MGQVVPCYRPVPCQVVALLQERDAMEAKLSRLREVLAKENRVMKVCMHVWLLIPGSWISLCARE